MPVSRQNNPVKITVSKLVKYSLIDFECFKAFLTNFRESVGLTGVCDIFYRAPNNTALSNILCTASQLAEKREVLHFNLNNMKGYCSCKEIYVENKGAPPLALFQLESYEQQVCKSSYIQADNLTEHQSKVIQLCNNHLKTTNFISFYIIACVVEKSGLLLSVCTFIICCEIYLNRVRK